MLKLRAQLELEQYIEEQAVELTPELEIDTICPLISLLLPPTATTQCPISISE